jgi:hypothetical protein
MRTHTFAADIDDLAFDLDEGTALAARVHRDQPRAYVHRAGMRQRRQQLEAALGVDRQRPGRWRQRRGVQHQAGAAPADREGREHRELRMALVDEAQVGAADPHRVEQHVALGVGDSHRFAPGAGLVVAQQCGGVVADHRDSRDRNRVMIRSRTEPPGKHPP